MGRLTTHVLDTSTGLPAANLSLALWALDPDGARRLLVETRTNADGRVDRPLLEDATFVPGVYELIFRVGAYFWTNGANLPDPAFLDEIPLRFGVADASGHLHVPLLVSPYGYATYRGS
ncbi:hydroxyisourate hydrolase [Pinisolibacter aquiterrae]|uniref:hydroxyisourate hydrolase n=1 Tax=Pinisolibacter aquiterrae TaxID=2815579 RepID=UPI001C3C4CC8|nr:hydroxyisourate hydrolase [Pinisolibacter aquiterrae]MBV5266747.1 hydroxyisourate hydrolase [Pinisolibacter aquiterrae]MCC8234940.1 hydroxyisourate hydrolase [Pinisolibacter aquiterrae]